MGQCPCLPSVHLFLVWMVGSVCSWQNPGTDLCPPLLTRLQDPGQGSGALSGICRKIWPGRENKYSPWFHPQYSQASLWNRASSMWSWPCLWRDGYLPTLWPTCPELSEPRGEVLQRAVYAPFPWQNWDHFTVSHWGEARVVLLLWERSSTSQNLFYVQFICFSSFVRQPLVGSKLAAFSWSVLRQYEEFVLFYLNAFKIVQKGVFQPLHRPHAHVSMPLQSWLVYSSWDNSLLIAEWTGFHLHTKVSQALLCTLIICVSIPLLPFLSLSFSTLDMFHFCMEAASWLSSCHSLLRVQAPTALSSRLCWPPA